jgi:hypothetical protein
MRHFNIHISGVVLAGILGSICATTSAQTVNEINVQQLQEYRPGWATIPSLQQPNFAYSEVNNSKLLAEAGENLNYLSGSSLIIGNTRGYQVIGPNGEVFFVDDIEKPKCVVVAQYVESAGGDLNVNQTGTVVSNVYIEQVDFQDCY